MTLQDYIQKDIERLEGMKEDVVPKDPVIRKFGNYDSDRNDVLQTIIDIKRKELEELNEKELT